MTRQEFFRLYLRTNVSRPAFMAGCGPLDTEVLMGMKEFTGEALKQFDQIIEAQMAQYRKEAEALKTA